MSVLRSVLILAALLSSACLAPLPVAAQSGATPGTATPGDLARWEPIPPIGSNPAWRILYLSTGLDGAAVPVTGVIAVPDQPVPAEGFPLLVVAHPSAGLGRQCAPSLLLQSDDSFMADLYQEILTPYLDAGFAIVMTDYQGLGAAGDPSYLIGAIEGRNVLDSARAARQFPETTLSETTLLIGHSQGGHAVAFALQLGPEYAPEIAFDGAVLAAPALDSLGIFDALIGDDVASENTSLVLFVMAAWSATYPGASRDQVTTPIGQELIETQIADACLIEAGRASAEYRPSELFLPDAVTTWAELAATNTPLAGPWAAPTLFVHGTSDEVIETQMTSAFVLALCESGSIVTFVEYPDVDHFGVLTAAESEILAWLGDRVAGEPAPSTCTQ